jgi:hypothetical protein
MNATLDEYLENECLSLNYLQHFHVTIQNRVEYIYKSFQALERFESYREVIMMTRGAPSTGIFSLFGLFSDSGSENITVDLLRHIDTLIRDMPAQLNEIECRAELSLPMLKHISDINLKIKEPVLIL